MNELGRDFNYGLGNIQSKVNRVLEGSESILEQLGSIRAEKCEVLEDKLAYPMLAKIDKIISMIADLREAALYAKTIDYAQLGESPFESAMFASLVLMAELQNQLSQFRHGRPKFITKQLDEMSALVERAYNVYTFIPLANNSDDDEMEYTSLSSHLKSKKSEIWRVLYSKYYE